MFHDVERPFERIYIFAFKKQFGRKPQKTPNLTTGCPKNDFGKVDEAIFQGVERPCEPIFFILDIKNSNWCKLLK
jgi:hypothetical protein